MSQDDNATHVEYDVSNIQVLTGMEAVRKRPGMYVGDTEDGFGAVNMVLELVDNAFCEAYAGFGDVVEVELGAEGWVEVRDRGRGIPVALHPTLKKPVMEVILTTLHAGGSWSHADAYKVSHGLHGVGVAPVNALSARLEVESCRDGRRWRMVCEKGQVVEPLHDCGEAFGTGTRVRFWHDPEIFTGSGVDVQVLWAALDVRAVAHGGVRVEMSWPQGHQTAHYPAGVTSWAQKQLEASQKAAVGPLLWSDKYEGEFEADVVLGWHSGFETVEFSGVGGRATAEGGTHVDGVLEGLAAVVERAARKSGRWSEAFHGGGLNPVALRTGLALGVSVMHQNPRFAGSVRDRFTSPDVKGVLKGFVEARLGPWLADRPELFGRVIGRALDAQAVVHRMQPWMDVLEED